MGAKRTVTVSGPVGSGKTTVAHLLIEFMRSRGIEVELGKMPELDRKRLSGPLVDQPPKATAPWWPVRVEVGQEVETELAAALDIINKIQGCILPLGTDPGPIQRMNAWQKRVDERARWISKTVECAKNQREAHEAFQGLSGEALGHAMCHHERRCKVTESAVQAYLDLCGGSAKPTSTDEVREV